MNPIRRFINRRREDASKDRVIDDLNNELRKQRQLSAEQHKALQVLHGRFEGPAKMHIDGKGDLIIETSRPLNDGRACVSVITVPASSLRENDNFLRVVQNDAQLAQHMASLLRGALGVDRLQEEKEQLKVDLAAMTRIANSNKECNTVLNERCEALQQELKQTKAKLVLQGEQLERQHLTIKDLGKANQDLQDRLVSEKRWENGFRNIVTIVKGAREPFEIPEIVETVRKKFTKRVKQPKRGEKPV